MDLDTVVQTLRDLLPELRRHGVTSIGVFGSLARRGAENLSHIDLFVRFDPDAHATLASMGRVKELLEQRLSTTVDLVDDHEFLSHEFRRAVERDLIRVA